MRRKRRRRKRRRRGEEEVGRGAGRGGGNTARRQPIIRNNLRRRQESTTKAFAYLSVWKRLGGLLGPSWGPLGAVLEASWGSLGVLLGPSWGSLGAFLGPSWRPWRPSWAILEAIGQKKRTASIKPPPIGALSISFQGLLGALLRLCGAVLGPSWGSPRAQGPSWAILESSGGLKSPSETKRREGNAHRKTTYA